MSIFNTLNVTRSEGNLKNGIKVVLFHRPGAPISTSAVLNSGSKYDPENMPGLAHFLEHMIVNGSEEFPSKDLLAEHIESVGGSYGAMTGQDAMWVNTEVSEKTDYERVVDIYNATLAKPLMDEKVFENEKQVVIKEIQKSESNPSQILTKTVRQVSFTYTPFEHEVLGTKESVTALKYAETMREYKKLFDKSRITFIVSGDISLAEVITHLDTISFLKGNDLPLGTEEFEFPNENKILATHFDATQTHISLGVPAPKSFTKDHIHLNLLGSILAGGRASRLSKRLRYQKGLVYGVTFGKIGGLSFGTWRIVTDTSDDKAQEVIDEIKKEIEDIRKNGVKESELEFIKNRRVKSLKRTMQTSNDWVEFHALAEAFSDIPYTIDTFIKDTQETTLEDINKVVKKYLGDEKWYIALCGRTKAESVHF